MGTTYVMTPEKAAAIEAAFGSGLYVEWYDYKDVGYALFPNILVVGHCRESSQKMTGRRFNVRSVSVATDGLRIETEGIVFLFMWSVPKKSMEAVL